MSKIRFNGVVGMLWFLIRRNGVTTQEGRVQGSGFRPDFTARAVARLGCGYLVEQRRANHQVFPEP